MKEGCTFCGHGERTLVSIESGTSICEICARNIVAFFKRRRDELVDSWDDEESGPQITNAGKIH